MIFRNYLTSNGLVIFLSALLAFPLSVAQIDIDEYMLEHHVALMSSSTWWYDTSNPLLSVGRT